MGEEEYELGYFDSKPVYVIDEDSGELVPVYLPVDAIMNEARTGVKAGNPLLDDINKELREEGLIEKLKELYNLKNISED
ncbi:hypothetical protein CMO90_03085 [Candidatus Woesearchaeota archaeon]|jgi:hypothetical protein|nr:hypothetical protein [Candidatus Woesearchaeota archaeon]|tara:strand:- start:783 stop:1022 length:240 start_codon:yes stop_codon:yes gene_type:complete